MAIKILTQNAVDNTNIDGARANNFNAGRRSGIVKGVLNEGTLSALSSNVIALDTCELRISGHRIVIDQVETRTLTSSPITTIRYSLIAQIIVDENSKPEFSLFIQLANTPLIQQNLDKHPTGAGTYQIELGRFSYNTNGEIVDIIRTAEIITGSGQNGYDYINIGEVKTTMVQSGVNAEVDIENVIDEQTGEKKTNFNFSIPETAGTSINIAGEQKTTVDFSSDPQTQINEKVSYSPQILLEEQQRQVRQNIGATSSSDVSDLINSISIIPKYSSFYSVSFGIGTNFTAPTNGWFRFTTTGSINDTWWNLNVNGILIYNGYHVYSHITMPALIPLKKGDVVSVETGAGELQGITAIFIPSEVL